MKNWKPFASAGGTIGLALTLVSLLLLAGAIVITTLLALAPDNAGANFGTFFLGLLCFGLFILTLTLAYRTFNYYRLRYSLDRNAITIGLGDRRILIPLQNIRHIVNARNVLAEIAQNGPGFAQPADASGETSPQNYAVPRKTVEVSETVGEAADSGVDIIEGEIQLETVEVSVVASPLEEVAEAQVIEEIEIIEETPPNTNKTNGTASTSQSFQRPSPNPGGSLLPSLKAKMKPFSTWKGCYIGKGQVDPLGEVQFYATVPFEHCLLISTEKAIYAISPQTAQQFQIEFNLRRNLGATENVREGVEGGFILNHPLWHDWLGRGLLLAGILANIALFVFLLIRFPTLDNVLRIHFNKFGEVDRLGTKADIMWLPLIGLLALFCNSIFGAIVHVKDRIPALLLYASTVVVQFMVWVAVLSITVDRVV